MTIQEVIDKFTMFGFFAKTDYMNDIAYHMSQKWSGVADDKIVDRGERSITFDTINHGLYTFVIFENHSVVAEQAKYEEEGRLFYFFAFGMEVSKIYRDDDLLNLYEDCLIELKKTLPKEELRNINLSLIGI